MFKHKEYSFREWPKMVRGRRASDAEDAFRILSHEESCDFFRAHPDLNGTCSCGGRTPTAEEISAAGAIDPKPKRFVRPPKAPGAPKGGKPPKAKAKAPKKISARQAAALDRIPGDGVTKPGGAPKGGNKKKAAS